MVNACDLISLMQRLETWCVCGWGKQNGVFHLRPLGSSYPSCDMSLLLSVESRLRTFFVVTTDNTDKHCEYIVFSKSKVKMEMSHPTGQYMHNCIIGWKEKIIPICINEWLQERKQFTLHFINYEIKEYERDSFMKSLN